MSSGSLHAAYAKLDAASRHVMQICALARGAVNSRDVVNWSHATKRDLADTLLAGADLSGKLSAEELLRLIRE